MHVSKSSSQGVFQLFFYKICLDFSKQTSHCLLQKVPNWEKLVFIKGFLMLRYLLSVRHGDLQLWRLNMPLQQRWNVPALRWSLVEQPSEDSDNKSFIWLFKDLGLLQCVSRIINFSSKCLRLFILLLFRGAEL